MISELAKTALEVTKETMQDTVKKSAFDPDKRIEAASKELKTNGETKKFNPDKRIQPNEVDDKSKEKIELSKGVEEYKEQLKELAEYPDTIKNLDFTSKDIKLTDAREKRHWFKDHKPSIISEWEKVNGKEWPRYTEDVYNDDGIIVRKAGEKYDAHHIKPLSWGGENSVSNITPMHWKDHKELHYGENSGYKKVDGILRGVSK